MSQRSTLHAGVATLGVLLVATACAEGVGPDDSATDDTGAGDTSGGSDTETGDTEPPATVTIGGTLSGLRVGGSVTLQDGGGDDLTLTADGPFAFATEHAPGTTYAVTVATQPHGPDQLCEVRQGAGTATTSVTDVAVVCHDYVARFAYIVAKADEEVRQYAVDPDSGALTFVARTTVGSSPVDVTLNPDETCAFVANYGSDDVSAFRIGPDGVLTPASPPTVAAGDSPWMVAVHPSGEHVYVSNVFSNDVSQYDLGADCALAPKATAAVAAGQGPAGVGVAPSGAYVYVANARSNDLSQYAVGSDGSLTPLGGDAPVYGGSGDVSHVVFDPTGEHVYVPADYASTIHQFAVGGDGALVPLDPASVDVPYPQWFTMDPTGARAWVSSLARDVRALDVAADGTLELLDEPAFVPDPGYDQYPQTLLIDPSGERLYAAPAFRQIRALDIAVDGSLSASPVGWQPAGFVPWSIAFSRGIEPVAPDIGFAYVVNEGDDTISQFSVDANGGLVPLSPPTVPTGEAPMSITVDPSGRHAWVANYDSRFVSQYAVGADGTLTPTTTFETGVLKGVGVVPDRFGRVAFVDVGHPVAVGLGADGALSVGDGTIFGPVSTFGVGTSVADPTGTFVLVGHTSLSTYTVGTESGGFGGVGVPSTWAQPGISGVAMDPLARYAYASDLATDSVHQFTVDGDGALTAMTPPTVAAGSRPAWVTLDPTGRFAYVANSAMRLEPVVPGTVSQYAIGGDGSLTPLTPATVGTGGQPFQITLDPTGRFAYVANYADDTVSLYTVGADGGLLPMSTATVDVGDQPRFVLVTSRWK